MHHYRIKNDDPQHPLPRLVAQRKEIQSGVKHQGLAGDHEGPPEEPYETDLEARRVGIEVGYKVGDVGHENAEDRHHEAPEVEAIVSLESGEDDRNELYAVVYRYTEDRDYDVSLR